ncbi:hypothetical protein JCM19053_5084 [Vibrio sp. JCM 19053]|nr:hypothetical protein JCM19053_5084 [Vibrio sp. JCM 19053]
MAVVCSQIGFFIYSRKLEKLKNRLDDLENKHTLETKKLTRYLRVISNAWHFYVIVGFCI